MSTFSRLDITDWANKNFSNLPIGDKRRSCRVIDIAKNMARFPGKSIPQLFKNTYAIKASYELFKQKKATPDNLQKEHKNLVYKELNNQGTYLLIEDTSTLSWSGNSPIDGLGPIGEGKKGLQGFLLHSVLAVKWSENTLDDKSKPKEVIGLADQQYKIRSTQKKKFNRKTTVAKTAELESNVWEKSLERLPLPPQNKATRWVRICDRGADIYEVLMQCLEKNYSYVIRASQDRCIDNKDAQGARLFSYIRSAPESGSFSFFLRSRPNRPSRTATLFVSFQQVKLKSPQRPGYKRGRLPSIECSVIRVWEPKPPEGVEGIEWILLSDQKITTFKEASTCVNQYACRWLIEDFHKALKTGMGAEKLQLEKADRLFAAVAIMSIVALRLIELRERLRVCPKNSAENAGLSLMELKILEKYLDRQLKTVEDVNLAIGRLGGHMNRKSDGMPGLITLWRGMKRLTELTEGVQLALKLSK